MAAVKNLLPLTWIFLAYNIVLVNPGILISTAEAFSLIAPAKPQNSIAEIIKQSPYEWKDQLENQFEVAVFKLHFILQNFKQKL